MRWYWLVFRDDRRGACEAWDWETAAFIASAISGREVITVQPIPYPCGPLIHNPNKTVATCHRPESCAGKIKCPYSPTCAEESP